MLNLKIISSFFLLFFLTNSACNRSEGNTHTEEKVLTNTEQSNENGVGEDDTEEIKPIVVGAEQPSEFMPLIQGKKVALLVNQTSMIGETHLADRLNSVGVDIKTIFAPEHGFRGKADAGAQIKDGKDIKTGIPLISLYGSRKKPTAADLAGLDYVIFDIQDVGARFYTYISSMSYVMEACAENNVKFMVLDRPNPNGHYVDGPILDKDFSSFIGLHEIPVVHGMTVGEYAQMVNGEGWLKDGIQCDLTVVKCQNYDHNTPYELPVKPSPNLPNIQSIYLYPSLCFFEGTVVSIGRGTNKQFQVIGHPDFPDTGFSFTPEPMEGASKPKLNGANCNGYDLSNIDLDELRNERKIDLSNLINFYKKLGSEKSFFLKNNFIDKLAGSDQLRKQIIAGKTEDEIRATWEEGLRKFKRTRAAYLLYP